MRASSSTSTSPFSTFGSEDLNKKMSSVHLFCALALLGVWMAHGHNMIPMRMRNAHKNISITLNLTESEIIGKPLFKHAKSDESCQRNVQLMNATLGVYKCIISNMLQQHTRWHKLEGELKYLHGKTDLLMTKLGQIVFDKKDNLSWHNKIKEDDLTHQKRALAQFLEMYQEAAVVRERCSKKAL
ncbi:uncharacterized protein ACB058_000850 [Synchiropus picturatus]